MSEWKWDRRFLDLATLVSTWSKDGSTQCGAVIVSNKNRIISMGFNGYPRGVPDDDSLIDVNKRELKYRKIVHAEINSIIFAQKDLSGCTMYVYPLPPCSQCGSAVIQSGITRVVTMLPTGDLKRRWEESNKITEEMFKFAGIILDYL